jgi:hypothetical protein
MYRYMNTSHFQKNGTKVHVRPVRRLSAGEDSGGPVYSLDPEFWFAYLAGSTGKVVAVPVQLEPRIAQSGIELEAA